MSQLKEKDLLSIPQDDYLDSFEVCQMFCDSAFDAHLVYWKLIDVCEDHIRGKRPKDPAKLKKAGTLWANNWNFLKARSKITGVVFENIDMIKNAITLASPSFNRKNKIRSLEKEEDRAIISMKISKVFAECLEQESNFNNWINSIEYPSTSFGFDAVIFDGEDNWMGDPTHPRNIAFEDKTEPENIGGFVIAKSLKAGFLWNKWIAAKKATIREIVDDDEDTKITSTNWSVDGLESVLWNALSHKVKRSNSNPKGVTNWEDVTQSIRSGSCSIQNYIVNTENVKIAKIFYKELNGKWTETYIPYCNTWQGQSKANSNTADKIIYKKHHAKKHQDRIINLIRDSSFTEGGFISEFRGLAKYTVEDSIRFNRKKNNIEDKLIFSGSPFFEQRNTQQKEAFKITPTAGFTLVKQGFDLIPNQPNFDLNNHLVSMEIDERHFLRETQHQDAKLEGRLTSRPVKDEVIEKSAEVKKSRASKNSLKLADYSKLFLNIIKNLAEVEEPDKDDLGYNGYAYFYEELEYELKDYYNKEKVDSKEFIKLLIESIVSYEIEPVLSDEEAIGLAISMSETSFARNRLKRMLLMAQGFPRKEIDLIAPLPTDSFRNLRDERVAAIENDMFWTTNEVIITDEDDDIDHLNTHYAKYNSTVQAVQQGRIDIIKAFKYLANLLSHSELHLEVMSRDPFVSKVYEILLNKQNEFTKILAKIKSAAEQEANKKAKEEGQIPPEKLRELEILEYEKVNKQRRTEELTKHKQALTEQSQAHRQAMAVQQQQFDQQIERIKTESENRLNILREASKTF